MTFWVISRDPFAAPDDRFEDLFHSFFVPFTSEDADDLGGGGISEPAVAISVAESDAIKRYFRGYNGNPTDINENFWRMMYFSVVVLTTIGFGDIVPITNVARFAVAIEAVTGITLVGLFLNALANRIARAATRF